MDTRPDPVYSHNVVEFVAVANEYCKYAEHASELKGDEMLKILQRILPLMYLKASLLPALEPFFEDGNEKFVTEGNWNTIHGILREKFGTANDYPEVFDERFNESETPVQSSLAENMADIYQDMKNFLLLYQTGTKEVMNDALWECRINFETLWGEKLLNTIRAIHNFLYSGKEIEDKIENTDKNEERDTDEWFISKRQKDLKGEDDEEKNLEPFIYHLKDERLLQSGLSKDVNVEYMNESAFITPFPLDRRIERQFSVFTFQPFPSGSRLFRLTSSVCFSCSVNMPG